MIAYRQQYEQGRQLWGHSSQVLAEALVRSPRGLKLLPLIFSGGAAELVTVVQQRESGNGYSLPIAGIAVDFLPSAFRRSLITNTLKALPPGARNEILAGVAKIAPLMRAEMGSELIDSLIEEAIDAYDPS